MPEPVQAPRGTRDLLPAELRLWQRTEETMRRVFERHGYGEIRTPLFEATELFARGIGEGTDIVSKEMYSFLDRKGRSLTLRPEGTAGAVRAYWERSLGQGESGEAKLYYLGPMFRYERPQAGRYRQFWQAGVEAIGFADPLSDAEVISMLVMALSECGLKGLSVDVNSVGCPQCRPAYLELLRAHLHEHEAELSAESRERLKNNPMRVMDSKDERDAKAVSTAPKVTNHLCTDCSAHFAALLRLLERAGVEHQVNKALVRGLDYYTRTAFEVLSESLGAQNAVAGGGRYDRLVGQFGPHERPAVGFGLGLDRLIQLLAGAEAPKESVQVALLALGALAYGKVFEWVVELRRLGISSWMDLSKKRGMKNQMKTASALGARLAVILGEDELKNGAASVKDMATGAQDSVPMATLIETLKRRLG
jgi:histidyl-tRNA synthetase